MKRKFSNIINEENSPVINQDFLSSCEEKFKANPTNIIIKNSITNIGLELTTTNSDRVNQIDYVFLNSIKESKVKATNQGASGRCWLFAGLNIFRHILMKALDLENFEFSEVYLFFWDKLERSNTYLKWFIDHPESKPGDRDYDCILSDFLSDGGFFSTFSNLIMKYGIVPKTSMKETFHSEDSEDMNKIIKDKLDSSINYISKNRNKLNTNELLEFRKKTVAEIYDVLVKFLGTPPTKFNWSYTTNEGESNILSGLTPKDFLNTVIPSINLKDDFVVLCNLPIKELNYYTKYNIKYTNNVEEGENCTIFNVPIDDIARYAMKSIENKMGVWFSADVSQCFNRQFACLDDKLEDHKMVFGDSYKFDKGEKIIMRNIQGNHAMLLTGFNIDSNGKPLNWQIENTWSFVDAETPGLDGYLNASQSWFEKYVMQIAVPKSLLSRSLRKHLLKESVELEPFAYCAPALKTISLNSKKFFSKKNMK
jgi:bleomycin hydrolase